MLRSVTVSLPVNQHQNPELVSISRHLDEVLETNSVCRIGFTTSGRTRTLGPCVHRPTKIKVNKNHYYANHRAVCMYLYRD